MKIKKCCKTCMHFYKGICANALCDTEVGYANKISDPNSLRHCWLIGIPTIISLVSRLTRLERRLITKAPYLSANDLIYRVENGYWPPKYKLFFTLNNHLLKLRGKERIKVIS